jgi:hypothetical protein
LPKRKKRAFEQIAPDAVFELLSPTDRLPYTVAKCVGYVAMGSDVAVLINPAMEASRFIVRAKNRSPFATLKRCRSATRCLASRSTPLPFLRRAKP